MKFYNRHRELDRLEWIVNDGTRQAHLVVLSGRRRIGKTALIRHFTDGRDDFVYLFVSKKKPHLLLAEFTELLSERIVLLKSATISSFEALFTIILDEMALNPLFVVLDEFQNFLQVDESVFTILQKLWDQYRYKCKGVIICIGSVQTLMRIFEGNNEPLFGRATDKIALKPLPVEVIAEILNDNRVDIEKQLIFYYSLFGGVPKYYSLLSRMNLFRKTRQEIIKLLFCESDAILQNEGRELLIEEFGKNYHLYFSIMQTVACGVTQMSQIADKTGIGVNSISKYLDELVSYYEVLERRLPITATDGEHKKGRYHIADPLLKFWFRYIHKNQSLVAIGEDTRLSEKIDNDLSTFMGLNFGNMMREVMIGRNDGSLVPFIFDRIGGYWDRNGKVEIDIVAMDKEQIFFAECKLNGNQFTTHDVNVLKTKGKLVRWGTEDRKEYFALIANEPLHQKTKKLLAKEGIICIDLPQLFQIDTYHSGDAEFKITDPISGLNGTTQNDVTSDPTTA
jgi:AAA+ ATPase superfamily predicted ATPase